MSVFHTHVGDFSVRMARIPEREYTQGARTPRGLYMWGLAWHSCVGEEVEVNCMIFVPFAFDPRHTKRHQLGGATETFFHRFFMKKHAKIMLVKKKRFCGTPQLVPFCMTRVKCNWSQPLRKKGK